MVDPEEPNTSPKFLLEDEELLTPECRSLLQTLPSEKGWTASVNLYLYHGFWYVPRQLNGVLSVQHNFHADHSDILLATNPKAGTTWLKALVFALLNRSYSSSSSSSHPLLQTNPHDLVPFLEMDLYIEDQDPDLSAFAAPRLFSTHIPFSSLPSSAKSSSNKCKVVYLCRNPKDTIISVWHFVNKLMSPITIPLEEVVDKFCCGTTAYGPFWDHAMEYWKASEEMPHKVLFLKYEEIKEQPYQQLKRLADFLGCPNFSQSSTNNDQEEEILNMCSFKNLSQLEVNQSGKTLVGAEKKSYFRRGEVGDWAHYLTQGMIQRIDRITEDKFHASKLNL